MKLAVILVMLLSGSVFAQLRCTDKLLPPGRLSGTHQLLQTEWRPVGPGALSVSEASRVVNTLVFGKLLCREAEITIDPTPLCTSINVDRPDHVTCQANSSLGHFVLTSDTQQTASIIFHRAQRPVDPDSL